MCRASLFLTASGVWLQPKLRVVLSRQQDDHLGGQRAAVEACRSFVLQTSQEAVHSDRLDTINATAALACAVQYDRPQPLAPLRVQATPDIGSLSR